ncbi:MAG TPA: hypothetical protein VFQ13_12615, partial [Anaerolineales bacterium]|nr:hypothetical protein [Anaerolineales bacterium]
MDETMKKLLLFLLCTFLVSSCGGVTPIPTATSTATMHPSNPPTSIPINKPAPVEIAITHPELEVITPENVHRIELIDRWGKGMVYGVELSPDGSQIAVGTSTGVYFYDRITAEPIGFINLPVAPNVKYNECNLQDKNISFSPDGRFLAIADIDINIWDLSANKLHKTITNKVAEPASIITEVKFSLDGSRIVTLQKSNHNDGRCYMGWRSFLIYDANSGEQIFRQDFEGSDEFPRFFRFDKNEVVKFLNPSIKGLEISSVDLFTGRIVKEDVIQMRHSALNFEGSIVVDWELNDNTNHLIDTNTNEEIRVVSDLVTILPVTQFVLVGQQNFVLQTLQGDLVCSFSNPDDIAPHRLRSFTKDGNMGLSWDDNRGEIRIWDFKNCTISDPILYFQEFERQLKFSPDGRSLLANSRGGYGYFILDAQSGDFRYTVETRNVYKVYGVDFSAGGRKIAVYNEDAIVEYDAVTGVKKGTLFVLERGFLGGRLEFNPNGSMVIYDDRNSTLLRGTLYGETIRNSSQGSFRFSADGSTLIT